MSKVLQVLQEIKSKPFSWEKLKDSLDIIEKELKAFDVIKKCFYVAKSSGAILLTDYGFEHKEELKEILK